MRSLKLRIDISQENGRNEKASFVSQAERGESCPEIAKGSPCVRSHVRMHSVLLRRTAWLMNARLNEYSSREPLSALTYYKKDIWRRSLPP
jgi:hypothetical protein